MPVYASVIWNPHHKTKIASLERVQRKFIRMQCFQSNTEYNSNDYILHCVANNLKSLCGRRQLADMTFLFNIVNGNLDSSLLQLINFHVPSRITRTHITFKPNKSRIDLHKNSSINRIQTSYNKFSINCIDLDINSNKLTTFKHYLKEHVI